MTENSWPTCLQCKSMTNPCRCPSGLPKYFLGHTEEVRTVATHPTAEQMAALEVRLQEAEKRLENLHKEHEADRRFVARLPSAGTVEVLDILEADTRRRVTDLEQAVAWLQGDRLRKRPARRRAASSQPRTPGRKATPSAKRSRAPASGLQRRAKRSRHMASAKTK